jgi:hypothetical protein
MRARIGLLAQPEPMRIFIKLIAPQFHFKPAKLQE